MIETCRVGWYNRSSCPTRFDKKAWCNVRKRQCARMRDGLITYLTGGQTLVVSDSASHKYRLSPNVINGVVPEMNIGKWRGKLLSKHICVTCCISMTGQASLFAVMWPIVVVTWLRLGRLSVPCSSGDWLLDWSVTSGCGHKSTIYLRHLVSLRVATRGVRVIELVTIDKLIGWILYAWLLHLNLKKLECTVGLKEKKQWYAWQ